MAGAHTSEKRWYRNQNPNGNDGVADRAQSLAKNILSVLQESEDAYQELLEMYVFVGGTDQLVANQLFKEIWVAAAEVEATSEQLAMVADLKQAVTSMHELYLCLTNTPVAQEDRLADLRRMS